jgi:hypothetical protein
MFFSIVSFFRGNFYASRSTIFDYTQDKTVLLLVTMAVGGFGKFSLVTMARFHW